jgi:hypothetical protein
MVGISQVAAGAACFFATFWLDEVPLSAISFAGGVLFVLLGGFRIARPRTAAANEAFR